LTFTPGKQIEIKSCHIAQEKAFHYSATLLKETETTPFYMRFSLKKKDLKE